MTTMLAALMLNPLTLTTATATAATPETTLSDPTTAIDTVLADFTQGAATRDTDRVRKALHPSAQQYVAMPDGLQVMGTDTYIGLLEAEKIGGTPTTRATLSLNVDGTQAVAHQTRDIGPVILHDAVTLVEADGRWQIVAVAVRVEPQG